MYQRFKKANEDIKKCQNIKLGSTGKLWHVFWHNCRQVLPKFYFWKGGWALDSSLPNFEIFLIFPKFLTFSVFTFLFGNL